MKLHALTLSLLLGLSASPALAADQYLVRVPANVNLSAATPETPQEPISVALSPEALPEAVVGEIYSFNFADRLTVTGGAGSYNLNDIIWAASESSIMPSGLTFSPEGALSGTPLGSEIGNFPITIQAGYQGVTGTNTYTLRLRAPSVTPGQIEFTNPGSYAFTIPSNVYRISAVVVGGGGGGGAGSGFNGGKSGGGGGGGGLNYNNEIPVTPGETLNVQVGSGGAGYLAVIGSNGKNGSNGGSSRIRRGGTNLVYATGGFGGTGGTATVFGSGGNGGTSSGNGTGFSGGHGGNGSFLGGGGGGGAAGYEGNGGSGTGLAGSGGGGGGGYINMGGGVGIYKMGPSGATADPSQGWGSPGSGGSSWTYGGGARGGNNKTNGGTGGKGGVRIIWGGNYSYPSNSTW
ncbi:MAG TPA: hypothetical protein PKV67_16475 [Hyphomonas sp.]|nr:hypothetical protein [Hyphomonas sp.]